MEVIIGRKHEVSGQRCRLHGANHILPPHPLTKNHAAIGKMLG